MKLVGPIFVYLKAKKTLAGVVHLVEALSCIPNRCNFNSWSGHMPWCRFVYGKIHVSLLHTYFFYFSLPLSLSLKTHGHIFEWGLKKKAKEDTIKCSRKKTPFIPIIKKFPELNAHITSVVYLSFLVQLQIRWVTAMDWQRAALTSSQKQTGIMTKL